MKKGEFFIISIAIIAFAIFFISQFTRSAYETQGIGSAETEAVQKMIAAKNSGNWWSYNWSSEMKITTGSNETGFFLVSGLTINDGLNCEQDIELLNMSKDRIESYVSEGPSPCSVVFPGEPDETYYVVYNKKDGCEFNPGLRSLPAGNFNETYSVEYQRSQSFCESAENAYTGFEKFSCTNLCGEKFSINYASKEFIYSGII